jgi:hypothetical protein
MKTLIALLAFTLFTSQAIAQKIVYACQFTESAGLKPDQSGWKSTSFTLGKPFFLTDENNNLTEESVAKVFPGANNEIMCNDFTTKKFRDLRHCMNGMGGSIYFNTGTLNGGISVLYASGFTNENIFKKDASSIFVSPFTCTKM